MSQRARPYGARLDDLPAASEYSGIPVSTLRGLIAAGVLPAVRPPGLRRYWVDRRDLDRALEMWKKVDPE